MGQHLGMIGRDGAKWNAERNASSAISYHTILSGHRNPLSFFALVLTFFFCIQSKMQGKLSILYHDYLKYILEKYSLKDYLDERFCLSSM